MHALFHVPTPSAMSPCGIPCSATSFSRVPPAVLRFTVRLRIFQKLNAPAEYAKDGQEALAMVEARAAQAKPPYSVIILDNQVRTLSLSRVEQQLTNDRQP